MIISKQPCQFPSQILPLQGRHLSQQLINQCRRLIENVGQRINQPLIIGQRHQFLYQRIHLTAGNLLTAHWCIVFSFQLGLDCRCLKKSPYPIAAVTNRLTIQVLIQRGLDACHFNERAQR